MHKLASKPFYYIFSFTFFSFYKNREDGDIRFLMTEPIHVGPSYVIQFDLVMGCHLMYDMIKNNWIYLEYSGDHGLSWSLVVEPCLQSKACEVYTKGTVYDPSQYTEWRQVTVPLPPATW